MVIDQGSSEMIYQKVQMKYQFGYLSPCQGKLNLILRFTKNCYMKKIFFLQKSCACLTRLKPTFQKYFLLFLVTFSAVLFQPLFAQTKTVTGTIKDENGEGLAGVTVTLKGTTKVATSSTGGNYSIS